jgi:hypothetical protein
VKGVRLPMNTVALACGKLVTPESGSDACDGVTP